MPWTPPEDEQIQPSGSSWTPPADEAIAPAKPGFMDVFPKMLKEASTMGTPNVAQTMFGDTFGNDQVKAPIGNPLKNDTEGLQDVSLQDAMTAYSLGSGLGELTGVKPALGAYAKRFGQNQAIKAMGASGGQIGQVGIPESREIAQSMIDKGVISPLRGPIGMEDFVEKLHKGVGQNIGQMRGVAETRGEAPQMAEILDKVNKDLSTKYGSGVEKAPAMLNRAKEEIAKGGTGTFLGNAQKATELNQAAAANKIYRPQGAVTDVADTITGMNKDKMRQLLSPEEMAQHEKDLSDYGPLNTVKEFMKRGERKEMAGRGGSSLMKTAADKTMDALGNRTAATIGSKLGDVLLSSTGGFDAAALARYLAEKYGNNKNP